MITQYFIVITILIVTVIFLSWMFYVLIWLLFYAC